MLIHMLDVVSGVVVDAYANWSPHPFNSSSGWGLMGRIELVPSLTSSPTHLFISSVPLAYLMPSLFPKLVVVQLSQRSNYDRWDQWFVLRYHIVVEDMDRAIYYNDDTLHSLAGQKVSLTIVSS